MCNATRMRNLQRARIREGIITEPSPNLSRSSIRDWNGFGGERKKVSKYALSLTLTLVFAFALAHGRCALCGLFPNDHGALFAHLEHPICALEMTF